MTPRSAPMDELSRAIRSSNMIRFFTRAAEQFADIHLKELTVEEVGPNREMVVGGHQLINFGFDSFLGLDQDPRVITFKHNDPTALEDALVAARPYRCGVIAIDGVYSMRGNIAAMPGMNAVARRHNSILYIDDAHATGVMGEQGRGTVLETLGSYDNTLVVGCLSKACSVFGAFVACTRDFQRLLKMKSNTYIFGGPVPPPYLEAISTVIDILTSDAYYPLRADLDANIERVVNGLNALDLIVLGGHSPIISSSSAKVFSRSVAEIPRVARAPENCCTMAGRPAFGSAEGGSHLSLQCISEAE